MCRHTIKFWDLFKLKAFTDKELDVAKVIIVVCESVENLVRKEENAGYQHFFLFPHGLQMVIFLGSIKFRSR